MRTYNRARALDGFTQRLRQSCPKPESSQAGQREGLVSIGSTTLGRRQAMTAVGFRYSRDAQELARVAGHVDASVVVVFELVADGNDHHICRRLDFDECDVARSPKGDEQFAQERTLSGLAACER